MTDDVDGMVQQPGEAVVDARTLPFAINIVANALFMPIFAGLRNVPLAAADIVIVWATILWCVIAIWPHYRWVAVAQVPYFVWVSLATTIQLSITAMNG